MASSGAWQLHLKKNNTQCILCWGLDKERNKRRHSMKSKILCTAMCMFCQLFVPFLKSYVYFMQDLPPEPESHSYSPPNCPALQNNDYEFVYSCSMPTEAVLLGIISLVLTILNILCIILMGIAVLKVTSIFIYSFL